MPETSIVILNYNGFEQIEKCFSSILEQDYKDFEIIFVDNGSDEEEFQKTHNFIIKKNSNNQNIIFVKLNKNFGYSIGKNSGAKKANGNYLFFLDNDISLKKNALKILLNFYKKTSDCGTICPAVIDSLTNKVCFVGRKLSYLGTECTLDFSSYEKIKNNESKKIGHPVGGAFLIEKKIWDRLGGFDESNFWSLDDFDLGARAWVYGYKNYCVISAKVIHYGKRWYNLSNKVWTKRYYNFTRGVLIMMLKNYQKKTLIISLPLFIVFSFLKGIKNSISRKSIGVMSAYFSSLCSLLNKKMYCHISNERKKIQNNRKISDSIFLNL